MILAFGRSFTPRAYPLSWLIIVGVSLFDLGYMIGRLWP